MKNGKLLVAAPSIIGDYNFQRSIILLVDHNEKTGTLGFIMNKKLDYTLDEVMEAVEVEFPLYFGGPVEPDNLFFLHRAESLIPNSIPIDDGLYWSGDFERVIKMVNEKQLSRRDIRFFLGYTGWGKGQLAAEIASESWVLTENSYHNEIISQPTKVLWKEQMAAMGGKYLLWSNAPENPNLN